MIEHVFFDLDHTLWDFERNSETCLKAIHTHQIAGKVPYEAFVGTFRVINRGLWRQLEAYTLTHDELRRTRFRNTLLALDIPCTEEESLAMNDEFMRLLPVQKHLIDGALEVLEYLHPKYQLHIISNGFLDIQTRKMTESGILSYFDQIITSDISGAKKPDIKIFDYALRSAGTTQDRSVYIGDDEIADKTGSENAGLPFIHFDPAGSASSHGVIRELKDLKSIL